MNSPEKGHFDLSDPLQILGIAVLVGVVLLYVIFPPDLPD